VGLMVVYLLHFHTRYRHAGHYLGSTDNLDRRHAAHRSGAGVRLMEVVAAAGIGFELARTWEGGRRKERQLKKQGGRSRMCPICKGT
jgi:predicted GIY-YIG superfamily endonuclease